jgi:hypothetical protein
VQCCKTAEGNTNNNKKNMMIAAASEVPSAVNPVAGATEKELCFVMRRTSISSASSFHEESEAGENLATYGPEGMVPLTSDELALKAIDDKYTWRGAPRLDAHTAATAARLALTAAERGAETPRRARCLFTSGGCVSLTPANEAARMERASASVAGVGSSGANVNGLGANATLRLRLAGSPASTIIRDRLARVMSHGSFESATQCGSPRSADNLIFDTHIESFRGDPYGQGAPVGVGSGVGVGADAQRAQLLASLRGVRREAEAVMEVQEFLHNEASPADRSASRIGLHDGDGDDNQAKGDEATAVGFAAIAIDGKNKSDAILPPLDALKLRQIDLVTRYNDRALHRRRSITAKLLERPPTEGARVAALIESVAAHRATPTDAVLRRVRQQLAATSPEALHAAAVAAAQLARAPGCCDSGMMLASDPLTATAAQGPLLSGGTTTNDSSSGPSAGQLLPRVIPAAAGGSAIAAVHARHFGSVASSMADAATFSEAGALPPRAESSFARLVRTTAGTTSPTGNTHAGSRQRDATAVGSASGHLPPITLAGPASSTENRSHDPPVARFGYLAMKERRQERAQQRQVEPERQNAFGWRGADDFDAAVAEGVARSAAMDRRGRVGAWLERHGENQRDVGVHERIHRATRRSGDAYRVATRLDAQVAAVVEAGAVQADRAAISVVEHRLRLRLLAAEAAQWEADIALPLAAAFEGRTG